MKKQFDLPVDFTVKVHHDEDDEKITIEGFANTTTVDRVGDIILEEAWTKGGLENYLKNPIILAYHNHDRPIGKMTDYAVNNRGLKIVADIYKSAGEIFSLIKSGVLTTFSVGFRTKDADYDTETDLFVIKDLELFEISVVSVPANADSTFSVRKSFETEDEFNSFKSEFTKGTNTVIAEDVSKHDSENIEENIMPDIDKAQLEADLRQKIENEIAEKAAREAALKHTVAEEVKAATTGTVEVVQERVASLKTDLEKRLADETKTFEEALAGLKAEIKEYAEQLTAFNNSKMTFTDKTSKSPFTNQEIDAAVLVAKMTNKPITETKYFQGLVEKSDQAHQTGMTAATGDAADWESTFSTRLWDDIRERLIIENLFTSFAMPSVTMNMPLNPEAGYGTWVTTAQLGAATSSGTARTHGLTDTTISAHKLATKELLTYEEEDDAMIAMVPLIRDAAVRRMAKSSDKALLLGDSGVSAGAGEGNYPFNGLATIAQDDTRTTTVAGANFAAAKTTVANLRAMRRQMGVHGHNPSDLVFVVSHDAYYDLLDDAEFQTMDKVGDRATILTGQIGSAGGTPVVVSGEFPAKATSAVAGICVNMANYILGNYKGLTIERERSVENQTNLLVVTRRFGMIELFPANPTVVALVYPAA